MISNAKRFQICALIFIPVTQLDMFPQRRVS